MIDRAAGERLRRYLREGMASAGVDTISELARRSGVGRDTLQVWMRGEHAPTPRAGQKVAEAIGSSYSDMLRAWEGDRPDVDPEAVVAALEWAIRLVRSGAVPPEVQQAVDDARRSASQRRRRGGG